MRNKILLLFIYLLWPLLGFNQVKQNDIQLAQYYFSKEEYQIASNYYEKIYQKDQSKRYFIRYIECLEKTNDIDKAEKIYKKQLRKFPNDMELLLNWAKFNQLHISKNDGDVIIEKIIKDISPNYDAYIFLIDALIKMNEFDFALHLIEQGKKILNVGFEDYRAKIYLSLNKIEEALLSILDMIPNSNFMDINSLTDVINDLFNIENNQAKDYLLFEKTLISKIQKQNSSILFLELLNWFYIQSNEFEKALKTSISIDKRINGDGESVLNLAETCMESQDFKTAVKAFRYLLEENTDYMYEGQEGILTAGYRQVTENRAFTSDEIKSLISDYEKVLSKYGRTHRTYKIILEYAHILGFYSTSPTLAINELKDALLIKELTALEKASIKMALANTNILLGDLWEASLLYSQIEKDFKYEEIGDLAKFKNAKIFYYDGEFDFAQSQLDVLKGSTSKLISNDAIQLSICITDNFGLDSNYEAMSWFAKSDLLVEQHLYLQATKYLDSISTKYPSHALGDEILWKKGNICENQGLWNEAIDYYKKLTQKYGYDILADDAYFRIGHIQETKLNDLESAKANYTKLLLEYKDSLHCTEARKRLRILRGDLKEGQDF